MCIEKGSLNFCDRCFRTVRNAMRDALRRP